MVAVRPVLTYGRCDITIVSIRTYSYYFRWPSTDFLMAETDYFSGQKKITFRWKTFSDRQPRHYFNIRKIESENYDFKSDTLRWKVVVNLARPSPVRRSSVEVSSSDVYLRWYLSRFWNFFWNWYFDYEKWWRSDFSGNLYDGLQSRAADWGSIVSCVQEHAETFK